MSVEWMSVGQADDLLYTVKQGTRSPGRPPPILWVQKWGLASPPPWAYRTSWGDRAGSSQRWWLDPPSMEPSTPGDIKQANCYSFCITITGYFNKPNIQWQAAGGSDLVGSRHHLPTSCSSCCGGHMNISQFYILPHFYIFKFQFLLLDV